MAQRPESILLVEDNADHAELVMEAIRACRVVNPVVWVQDGERALAYLRHEGEYDGQGHDRPAVVLLDIRLPGVDGLDVLREIKTDEALATMPVVILTTSERESEIVKAYHFRANSYVVKPKRFEDFFQVVQDLNVYWALTNRLPELDG